MTKLSVNINKIATLRNARGGNNPDVVKVALDCEKFGAEGITVHPRPDERHVRRSDVYALRPVLSTEFNIEGYPSEDFIDLVLKVKPHQVTLVPDAPDQITSNAGWDTIANIGQELLIGDGIPTRIRGYGIHSIGNQRYLRWHNLQNQIYKRAYRVTLDIEFGFNNLFQLSHIGVSDMARIGARMYGDTFATKTLNR